MGAAQFLAFRLLEVKGNLDDLSQQLTRMTVRWQQQQQQASRGALSAQSTQQHSSSEQHPQ
jgi:hypothetical protein